MSATKAAAISPLAICAAAPFYAAWLYHQTTGTLPTTPTSFSVVLRIASTWVMLFLPLAYILTFTYGQLFLRLARARGWSAPLHYLLAGILPGLLTLLLPFSWKEAFVPAVVFGAATSLAFWWLNRDKPQVAPPPG